MRYDEVLKYIEERNKLGSVPGLDNILGLLRRLGNPEKGILAFHIAGTNGKGSIMAYVETVLIEAGYKVGRYISPTIIDYRERWQINKEYMPKRDCGQIMGRIIEEVGRMEEAGEGRPTSFEIETAAAFLWFKKKGCNIILIECGMGGGLDATNVFTETPIDVLASISFDHMQFLGNTLTAITKEKLGIVKKDDILVSYPQTAEPKKAVDKLVKKNGMDDGRYFEADPAELFDVNDGMFGSTFTYKNEKYEIKLAGAAQVYNAITAIEAIEAFNSIAAKYGLRKVPKRLVKKGLKDTGWQGRFSVLSKDPLFIVDGAHNSDAWEKLEKDVRKYFTNKKLVFIIGVLRDKEYDKMLKLLTPVMASAITVTTDSPRALDGGVLAELIRERGVPATYAKSIKEAVRLAKQQVGELSTADNGKTEAGKAAKVKADDCVIIACGTLSFVGDIIKTVK